MAITRSHVVAAALQILDEYGLADLSMRRVASRLEVQPGALYHHVANKQTLLAGIADQILQGVECPVGPWRESVAGWATNLREALLAHRDSADLVASARAFRLVEVEVTERPVLVMAAAGVPPAVADSAASTLVHFVLGHVSEEQAKREWLRFSPPGAEMENAHGRDDHERFVGGVQLILDGASTQLP